MATSQIFKDYIVRFRKGDRIYSAGDAGTEMYIVQSGAVEIFRETADRRIPISVMEKGDFFGEMALIESVPHATCAEAIEDSELIEINSTLFDRMIKGNIEIAVRMLRKLSIRLRDANLRLEEAASRPQVAVAAAAIAGAVGVEAPSAASSPGPGIAAPSAEPTASTSPELTPPRTPSAVPALEGQNVQRPKGCHAVLMSEEGQELFHIVSNRAVIGRFDPVTGLKPEVDLSSLDLNRSVSRHHARLTLEGGVYSLTEEVGALNGTFINGRKLVSGKPSRVKTGDTLNLGMVKLLFRELSPV